MSNRFATANAATNTEGHIDRDEAKDRIKDALKTLTGRAWSVTGGRGTAWGWIDINVFPREREDFGRMPEEAQDTLRAALDLDRWPLHQGYSLDPKDRAGFVKRLEARAAA